MSDTVPAKVPAQAVWGPRWMTLGGRITEEITEEDIASAVSTTIKTLSDGTLCKHNRGFQCREAWGASAS